MTQAAPVCSLLSRALGEPLYGTASQVRAWALLEQPGTWGREAPTASGLGPDLGRALLAHADAARVRLLLIRRHGRSRPGPRRLLLAHTGRWRRWIDQRLLDDPAELLGLDLRQVRAGLPPAGGEPVAGPVHLVCTNGRHDRCCATFGRPLAAALAASEGDRVWECSHIGGDRFAGNLVCFPHGLYYGRVGPAEAPRVAAAYRAGVVDLAHFRGRCHDRPAAQAAEWLARSRLGLDRLDGLVARALRAGPGGLVEVDLDAAGLGLVRVTLRVAPAAAPRPLTCTARRLEAPPTYALVGLAVAAAG